jgi:hypothetical protein
MRGTLEPMEPITRAEFNDRMERLATKKDLDTTNKALAELRADMLAGNRRLLAAIAPLPTKTEMHQAIAMAVAPLATKVELHETVSAAVAPLATKADITPLATKLEVAHLATRTEFQEGFARIQSNHETLKKDVKDLTEFLEAGLTENEARLRDLEAKDLEAKNRRTD